MTNFTHILRMRETVIKARSRRCTQQTGAKEVQKIMKHIFVMLVCAVGLAWCAHDFSSYPFKVTLNTAENGGLYELYWNFDNAKETIYFAVRVQTAGWVGFGLSPNGQMPNSDVVVGWVTDGGDTVFHVSLIQFPTSKIACAYAGPVCKG